jgi:hypothetical protein
MKSTLKWKRLLACAEGKEGGLNAQTSINKNGNADEASTGMPSLLKRYIAPRRE